MLKNLRKRILVSIVIAAIFYLGFTIYADYNKVLNAFGKFGWWWLPLLLLFSLINYYFRFLKWDYYLGYLGVKVPKIDSFSIFMSGLIMSITPGKMGELLKAYLVKQITNEPVTKTAPIIFAERVTDFLSLVIISVTGAYVYDYGKSISLLIGLFFVSIVVVITNRKLALFFIGLLEKVPAIKGKIVGIHNLYESSYKLLQFLPLVKMVFLSLISWFFECISYFIILNNYGLEVSVLWASFAYAFGTIVGALSMLPGGLGVTEGSLTFLVNSEFKKVNGIAEIAVASTFLIRVVTLWFALIVGIIAVVLYQKRFGEITEDFKE